MKYLNLTIVILSLMGTAAFAEDPAPDAAPAPQAEAPTKKEDKKKDDKFRNFYEVLEDVVADFEYDLKNGQVSGLKDLSIRNLALSENVPPSFKEHLELMLTERILKNAKSRIIQCLPCRSRTATLSGNQVVISSPGEKQDELARIAKKAGIANFMDVAFSYQPTGLILSLYTTDAESGAVVWSRSYNSETSRAAAFRRGEDYTQIEDARQQTEYSPTIQYRLTTYFFYEKSVSEYVGTLGLGFRMMERYDNRKKEVGFEMNYLLEAGSIVGPPSTDTIYTGFNLTLLFVHAWNFLGPVENFNFVRGSLFTAIGGTYAAGFLGGLIRVGYEWRLGKHWGVSAVIGYRPVAARFVSGSSVGDITGIEGGLGVSALF